MQVSKHHSHCAPSFPAPFSLNLSLHWSFKKEGLLGFLNLVCFFFPSKFLLYFTLFNPRFSFYFFLIL